MLKVEPSSCQEIEQTSPHDWGEILLKVGQQLAHNLAQRMATNLLKIGEQDRPQLEQRPAHGLA